MGAMRKLILAGFSVLLCHLAGAAGKASHVVLIVWDGMRPDLISKESAPTLFEMASHGVMFLHHHPVYISSTEVNGTALATGVYPAQSTLIANVEFRPSIDPLQPVDTQSLKTIRKGDELSGGNYLAYPTVSEILHENGLRTVIAGSKPVAVLHDRAAREPGALGVSLFAGETLPADVKDGLVAALGPFPAAGTTKTNIDQWTASALVSELWKGGVPSFTLLWLAEPDYSQHKSGPGAPNPMLAIKNSDNILSRVLQALKDKNVEDSTDVIVVSDHGFSTVDGLISVRTALNGAGLRAFNKFSSDNNPAPGDIMVVNDGGAVLCYVTGHEQHEIEAAVRCLQAQPSTGVLFTQKALAGTFPLSEIHLDSPGAPDIVIALRWKLDANQYGVPGLMYCDHDYGLPNKGSHATLSPTEMHNTGVAFGPDFLRGMNDSLPTGNIDIAPTILWILGVQPKRAMSGRVLSEALNIPAPPAGPVETHHKEATCQGDGFVWRQYLDISEVNGVTYFDQGNGSQDPVQSGSK
jgi:arylsulfatase A-like enzyme